MSQQYCTNCKEPCELTLPIKESQGVTYLSRHYVSDCCLEEATTDTPEEQRMNEAEYKQGD